RPRGCRWTGPGGPWRKRLGALPGGENRLRVPTVPFGALSERSRKRDALAVFSQRHGRGGGRRGLEAGWPGPPPDASALATFRWLTSARSHCKGPDQSAEADAG